MKKNIKAIIFLTVSLNLFSSENLQENEPERPRLIKLLFIDLFIGSASGAAAMTVYAPFGYFQNCKINTLPIQWTKPTIWWRGLPSLATGKAPFIATQTAAFGLTTHLIKKVNHQGADSLSTFEKIIAATLAGGLSGPIDTVPQLIALHQQQNGTNVLQTINSFPNGYRSLMRGSIPSIYRAMIFTNAYMNLLPKLYKEFRKYIPNDFWTTAISTPIAGGMVALTTQPLMVVVTRMHTDIKKEKYAGMLDVIKEAYEHKDYKGFFKGTAYRSLGIMFGLPVLEFTQRKLKVRFNS